MEGRVFEYVMEGFDLGEEEAKVEVEEDELSREERAEIEDKVAGALKENYNLGDFSVAGQSTTSQPASISRRLCYRRTPGSD